VSADDALQQPFVAQVIEALLRAVALPARKDEREVAGTAGLEKALLQRNEQLIGVPLPP